MLADTVHHDARQLAAGLRRFDLTKPAGSATSPLGLARALASRMQGPGGCYNMGNILALSGGFAVQLISVPDGAAHPLAIAGHYLFGSPGATTLSVAIIIFLIAGEFYHRAWADGPPSDPRLNHLGDLLSGVASLVLTAALVMFGDFLLAIVSGFLLAGGKFGSAFVPDGPLARHFRHAVLLSRLPALAALGVQFLREFMNATPETPAAALAMPVVMIVCYLIWARADWLLLRPANRSSSSRAASISRRRRARIGA